MFHSRAGDGSPNAYGANGGVLVLLAAIQCPQLLHFVNADQTKRLVYKALDDGMAVCFVLRNTNANSTFMRSVFDSIHRDTPVLVVKTSRYVVHQLRIDVQPHQHQRSPHESEHGDDGDGGDEKVADHVSTKTFFAFNAHR